jgi:hypothetical protein
MVEKRLAMSGARRVRAALRVEAIDWWTGMRRRPFVVARVFLDRRRAPSLTRRL